MTRFTRHTYRVARRRAINRLINAANTYNQVTAGYARVTPTHDPHNEQLAHAFSTYEEAKQHAYRIVTRGRREHGLW